MEVSKRNSEEKSGGSDVEMTTAPNSRGGSQGTYISIDTHTHTHVQIRKKNVNNMRKIDVK